MSLSGSADTGSGQRCFIALLPDEGTRGVLRHCRATLQRANAGAARGLRWVEPAALHLTLRFLGPSSRAQVDDLVRALPTLARALPVLATHRCAIWPNRARPRLLVLELAVSTRLSNLADACEACARSAGFAADTRGFRAHVSLARLHPGCAFGALPQPPPALRFDSLALLHSTLAQPAAIYTELARAALVPAPRS